jgi:hypothetical protein
MPMAPLPCRVPLPLLVSPNACARSPTSCKGSTGAPRAITFAAIWSTSSIVMDGAAVGTGRRFAQSSGQRRSRIEGQIMWLSSRGTLLWIVKGRILQLTGDLAGHIPLEAPLDLPWRLALSGSSLGVGRCRRVVAQPAEDHRMQGPVELPVAGAVEAVTGGQAPRRRDRRRAGQHGERAVVATPKHQTSHPSGIFISTLSEYGHIFDAVHWR